MKKSLVLAFSMLLVFAQVAESANEYYSHGSFPAPGSPATSASMRAELDLITAGFDKLPALTGNALRAVIVNSGGTGLTLTTGQLALGGNLTLSGAFNLTLIQGASVSLTLPTSNDTLVGRATTDTLSNKTLASPLLTGTLTSGGNVLIGSVSDKLNAVHLAIALQATGDLLYASSGTAFTRLAAVADGQVLRSAGVGTAPIWGSVRLSGATTDITGTLGAANGGTGQSTYTKGDLLAASAATTLSKRGVGADGTTLISDSNDSTGVSYAAPLLVGTSRFEFVNATTCQLGVGVLPVKIDGVFKLKALTAAITIGNGGLAATTTYFAYVYNNAGTLTLEFSTTGHVTDTTYGVEVKIGDATRGFIGWVRTNGSSQFQQDDQFLTVKSYYRSRSRRLTVSSTQTTSSTSLVTLGNFDLTYIADGREAVIQGAIGRMQNTTTAASEQSIVLAEDAVNNSQEQSYRNSGVGENGPLGGLFARTPVEGAHTANIRARVVSGTGQFEAQHTVVLMY